VPLAKARSDQRALNTLAFSAFSSSGLMARMAIPIYGFELTDGEACREESAEKFRAKSEAESKPK